MKTLKLLVIVGGRKYLVDQNELFCQTSIKMLVSQMRKLRGRDVNNLPQASWLESRGWNPGRLAPES